MRKWIFVLGLCGAVSAPFTQAAFLTQRPAAESRDRHGAGGAITPSR
jgi:hypothetical protein